MARQLEALAGVGDRGGLPIPLRLILRRFTFQDRYSPFERFQFMNCAQGRLKQEMRLLHSWGSERAPFFREFVKLRRDIVQVFG